MSSKPQQLHRSFLLRLWRAGNGHAPEWRYSLEDVRTHERHGFADLASLVVFLEGQIGDRARQQQIIEPRDTSVD